MADDELVQIQIRLKDARKFIGDAKLSERAVKGIGDETSRSDRRARSAEVGFGMFSKGIGGLISIVAIASAALVALTTVGIGASISAFAEAEVVSAKLNAVLKATGGVANVTAKDVGRLADSLSLKTGIDDDQIAGAETLLLTFKKVRNDVGATGDIFDRATKAALDMSVVTGKDLNGTVTALGKALNDPAKGAMALGKSGAIAKYEMAELQKMVKAGEPVWKQQEFILKALETQYGGAAAAAGDTFGGSLNRLKVVAGNAGEMIGGALAPGIKSLADRATTAASTFMRARDVGASFGFAMATALDGAAGGGTRFRDAFNRIKPIIDTVVKYVMDTAIPALKSFGADILEGFAPLMPFLKNVWLPLMKGIAIGIIGAIVGAWKVVWPILKLWFRFLGWVGDKAKGFGGQIEGLGKVIGFVFAGPILKGVGLLAEVGGALGAIARAAGMVGTVIIGLGGIFGRVLGVIARLVGRAFGLVNYAFAQFAPVAAIGLQALMQTVRSAIGRVLAFLAGIGSKFVIAGKSIWTHLVEGLKGAFGTGLGFVGNLAKDLANAVIGFLNDAIPNSLEVPGKNIPLPDNPIPMLAGGGVLTSPGRVVVGDGGNGSGAEYLDLPRGARVRPLSADERSVHRRTGGATPAAAPAGRSSFSGDVYLNGRLVGSVIADDTADDLARK